MAEWFHKQNKLIQIILLILPFVGWIVELLVRWSAFLKKGGLLSLAIALIYTFTSWIPILHWIDAVWVLLYNKFILE